MSGSSGISHTHLSATSHSLSCRYKSKTPLAGLELNDLSPPKETDGGLSDSVDDSDPGQHIFALKEVRFQLAGTLRLSQPLVHWNN